MAEEPLKKRKEKLVLSIEAVQKAEGSLNEADLCAKELRRWTDSNKIRPMKKLAEIGGLKHLQYILPLTQYSSDFLKKLAKNSACRIILRELRESSGQHDMSKSDKEKYIDLLISLEPKYKYIKESNLSGDKIQTVLFNILAQEDKEFTAKKLGEILVESDKQIRASAVKIIAEMLNNTQTNLLIRLLRDPDARVRANVIEALESIGNANVVGILLRYKMDKDERVRANTLKALWNLGYRDIEGSLSDMLLESKVSMQLSGIWLIGEIGHNQPAIKSLLRIVEYEEDPGIRLKISQAKRKIALREKAIRILVIDQDKDFLRKFFQQLAKDGFHILAAFDGTTGIRSAVSKEPDMVVINDGLPDISGIDVIKQIKQNASTQNIPVIFSAAADETAIKQQAEQAGACRYLTRPFEYDEFVDAVMGLIMAV